MPRSFLLLITLCISISSCGLPKDPHQSWEGVTQDGLSVGIVQNPPYASFEKGKANGSEVRILENFANENGITISYHKGSESQLVKHLENYELDVVVGGFDKKTVWKEKVGLTVDYDKSHVMFVPKGENALLFHLEKFLIRSKK